MDDILAELAATDFRGRNFAEYQIQRPVQADHVKAALHLPFEIAITELDNELILTTHSSEVRSTGSDYINRQLNSRLSFHTHNDRRDGIIVDTPSFQDIVVATATSNRTKQLVAHATGITYFGHMTKHPVTGEDLSRLQKSVGEIFNEYQRYIGAVLHRNWVTKARPFITEKYSLAERTQLAKDFIKKSGMLIAEAAWEDVENINKFMRIINLEE